MLLQKEFVNIDMHTSTTSENIPPPPTQHIKIAHTSLNTLIKQLLTRGKRHDILPQKNQIFIILMVLSPVYKEWRAHLRGLAPGQHSSEKTAQQWRAVCVS